MSMIFVNTEPMHEFGKRSRGYLVSTKTMYMKEAL